MKANNTITKGKTKFIGILITKQDNTQELVINNNKELGKQIEKMLNK